MALICLSHRNKNFCPSKLSHSNTYNVQLLRITVRDGTVPAFGDGTLRSAMELYAP
jgi:hypothetical protein